MDAIPAEPPPGQGKRSFLAIEGFRGLAALAVATGHAAVFFKTLIPLHFCLAVDFFFILSGIVLAHSYDRRLAEKRMSGWDFVKLRALRLYPVIVMATAFAVVVNGFIVAAHSAATPFHDYYSLLKAGVLTAFLIPQSSVGVYYPLNGPFWSLLFELIVSVVFGFLSHWIKGQRLIIVIAASAIAMIVLTPSSLNFDQGSQAAYAPLALARTAYSFFVGVMIARVRHGVPRKSKVLFLTGAGLLCAVLWAPVWSGVPFDTIAALVFLPPIAWLAVKIEPGAGLNRIARFLGKASYPLYAFNLPSVLLAAALVKLSGLGTVIPSWLTGLAFLALSLCVAYAVDKLLDEPVRAALKRRLFRSPSQSPAPVSPDRGGRRA